MIDKVRLAKSDLNNEFELTNEKISTDHKGKYILIGRGM